MYCILTISRSAFYRRSRRGLRQSGFPVLHFGSDTGIVYLRKAGQNELA